MMDKCKYCSGRLKPVASTQKQCVICKCLYTYNSITRVWEDDTKKDIENSISRFFSRQDIGGVNESELLNSLKFTNLKNEFVKHIIDEIEYLNSLSSEPEVLKRISDLKILHYEIINKV